MDTQLRAGVIGVGALGRHHARLYKQNEKVKTVGIFDVNRETAEAVGREFDIPVFDDWKKLADSCDLLSVAVPAIYHEECTIPLLNMGKHVLVEKFWQSGILNDLIRQWIFWKNTRKIPVLLRHTGWHVIRRRARARSAAVRK